MRRLPFVPRLSLTWQIGLVAFAILSLLAIVTGRMARQGVIDTALHAAKVDARDTLHRQLVWYLSPEDFAGPMQGPRLAEFDKMVKERVIDARTVSIAIWNADGALVYGSDPRGVQRTFADQEAWTAAAQGEGVAVFADGAPPARPENQPGDDIKTTPVAVYLPIRFKVAPDVHGVVAVSRLNPVDDGIGSVQYRIPLVLGAGFVLLSLAVFIITRGRDPEQQRNDKASVRDAAIVQGITDPIITMTPTGRLLTLNLAGFQMLGISPTTDITKKQLTDHTSAWARDVLLREGLPMAIREGRWIGEIAIVKGNGVEVAMEQVIVAHRDRDGSVSYLSTLLRDISDRKEVEAHVEHITNHDGLTGVVDRRRFEEEVQREIFQASNYGTHGALIAVNIDNFKMINERLGHRVGDALLIRLASLMRKQLRDSDIVSRLNGDEFAALLCGIDQPQVQAIANRMQEAIRRDVTVMGGHNVRMTVSMGIVYFPEHAATTEELLIHAERAIRQARTSGRDTCVVYKATGEGALTGVESDRAWEFRIRDALANDKFVLLAQPILDLKTDTVSQYELLIRLTGDDGEVVPPNVFLGVAERTGLIQQIDRWVVKRAIQILAEHKRLGSEITFEINLSGMAFTDRELLPLIQYELLRTRIDASRLTLEITETAAIADMEQAQQFISTLQGWGCKFAIDDFGVGFSSFTYLKHLPVDYVKLDGSFIRNLPRDEADQHLVKAMVQVGRVLGKKTIAEFVGDEETVELLRRFGVDYAQGFHVGRPQQLETIELPVQTAA